MKFKPLMAQYLDELFKRIDNGMIVSINHRKLKQTLMEISGMTQKKSNEWIENWEMMGYFKTFSKGKNIDDTIYIRCMDVNHPLEFHKNLEIRKQTKLEVKQDVSHKNDTN